MVRRSRNQVNTLLKLVVTTLFLLPLRNVQQMIHVICWFVLLHRLTEFTLDLGLAFISEHF